MKNDSPMTVYKLIYMHSQLKNERKQHFSEPVSLFKVGTYRATEFPRVKGTCASMGLFVYNFFLPQNIHVRSS